jgi:hypothetical protein
MGTQELPPNVRCPCGSGRSFADCCGAKGLNEAELRVNTIAAMKAAGIAPSIIYAYERTGLIVTGENRKLMSAADLDEWEDALAEYDEEHPSDAR